MLLYQFLVQFNDNFLVQFNDEEGENLKDIYNSDWAAGEAASAVGSAARNLETVAESGLSSLVNKAIKLIN